MLERSGVKSGSCPEVLVLSHLFPTKSNPAMGNFVDQLCRALADENVARPIVLSILPTRISVFHPIKSLKLIVKSFLLARFKAGVSPNGVPVYASQSVYVPGFGIFNAYMFAFVALRIYGRIGRRMGRSFDIKAVHAHTHFYDGFAGLILSRRLGVPLIVTEHTGPFSSITNSYLKRALVAKVAKHAAKVVAVSHALKATIEHTIGDLGGKIMVIPNALNVRIFVFQGGLDPAAPKQVGWLGHVDPIKRIDRLIACFIALREQDATLKLRIIAPSKDRFPVELMLWREGLQGSVEYASPETQNEVAHELAKLSVLLVTSDIETFSMAALEATASGVPVVSTDCGGPSDILFSPSIGKIGRDEKEIVSFARDYLANDSTDSRSARAGMVHDKFAAEKTAKLYENVYRQVLADHSSVKFK